MADVKRFNSKNGIENGAQESNLSMSDILISQHITGDNNDYKLTLAQAQAIPYGVCESLGDEDKTVNLINYPSTYTAQVGNKVLIKFIHANTKGHVSDNTYPTLTVGGVTKPIAAQGKTIGAGAIVDDQIIELVLTPDYWNIDQNIREVTSAYTILTDGSYIYNKTQIDNNNYTKAQTDSAINGALVDYDKLNTSGIYTDANDCIPEVRQKKRFLLPYSASNLPITAGGCVIEATRQFYSNVNYHSVLQVLYQNSTSDNTLIAMYIRNVNSQNGGDTWNWGNWVKLESINKVFNLTTYAYNKVHEYIKDNWNDIPIGKSNYELSTSATGTANYTVCEVTKQSDTFGEVLVHSYYGDLVMINYNGVWSIQKVVTENNLTNSLAGATTSSKFPIAKASLSSYMPFKLYLLGGSNHLIIVEGTLSNWNGNVSAFVNVKSDLVSNVSYDNNNEQLVVTTLETCYLGKISIFNPDTWCSIP